MYLGLTSFLAALAAVFLFVFVLVGVKKSKIILLTYTHECKYKYPFVNNFYDLILVPLIFLNRFIFHTNCRCFLFLCHFFVLLLFQIYFYICMCLLRKDLLSFILLKHLRIFMMFDYPKIICFIFISLSYCCHC